MVLCIVSVALAFTPAVIFMNNRYSVIQFHRELNMKFLSAGNSGYSVKAENNGKKYTLSPANYDRLSELLTYSKKKAYDIPSFDGKDIITLKFSDGSLISIIDYDHENDIAYIIFEEDDKVTYYTVTDLNLYNWMNEVVDDDGFGAPNKILPN